VAPTPVFPLCSGVLPVVPTIGPALNHVITPVGAIFAVVPVVVVAVVPIVDPDDLHAGFLRLRAGHGYRWGGKSSAQKQQAEVSIEIRQDVFLPSEVSRFKLPVVLTMHFWPPDVCFIQHPFKKYNFSRPRSGRTRAELACPTRGTGSGWLPWLIDALRALLNQTGSMRRACCLARSRSHLAGGRGG